MNRYDRQGGGGEGNVLFGTRGWLITDGKMGMDVQVRGVADALGLNYEMKCVAPRALYRLLAPWGPADPNDQFGGQTGLFSKPWPAVALATGRAAIPYIRKLRRLAGPSVFTVVLQDPKTGPNTADLIWVPHHDRLRGPNVLTTPTAPHSFSADRLAALRATAPPEIAALPTPRVGVILGGKNAVYKYTDADDQRLKHALQSIARLGASFMITPSRRTHDRLFSAVDEATADAPRVLWRGEGDNPYPQFLAHADLLIVTADSVNMTGEACATGRPVYVFHPSRGSAKFRRFHEALVHYGATRPLPDDVTTLMGWAYAPLDSAKLIATEIERRYLRRTEMLAGLMTGQG